MGDEGARPYYEALAAWRRASATFQAVRLDYRAKRIGDAEFMAARRTYNAASAAMDYAEQREQARLDAMAGDP